MGILEKIIKEVANNPKLPKTLKNQPGEINSKDAAPGKSTNYYVAGVAHYKETVLNFGKNNPQYSLSSKELLKLKIYDTPIFEYTFKTGKTELIPEPTNPHDPNAVKVLIDGNLVGYIKKGSCKRVLNLINQNRIEKIDSKIKGGNFKILWLYEDDALSLERGRNEYDIVITITEKAY